MYPGNYGFNNGAPPPPMSHGPGSGPNQPLQQHQLGGHQSMGMYSPQQQFSMGSQGASYSGQANMMPGGMMQNPAMSHMAVAGGQMTGYPQHYSSSSFGTGMSPPMHHGQQMSLPPNYAMGGGMPMPGYPMHPGQMTPQQHQHMMAQRMQPPHTNAGSMSASTQQRPFAGPGLGQGGPGPGYGQGHGQAHVQGLGPGTHGTSSMHPSLYPQQLSAYPSQGMQGTAQSHTPSNLHQHPHRPPSIPNAHSPQTPSFASNVQGAAPKVLSSSIPASPGSDVKDQQKEKHQLLLEINSELLLEAMSLQATQNALAQEHKAEASETEETGQRQLTEEERLVKADYLQCMTRLQSNLSYLTHVAHHPEKKSQAPTYPILKAPTFNPDVKLRPWQGQDVTEGKPEPADRDETGKYLHTLYKRLQAFYPTIDPNAQPPSFSSRQGTQGPNIQKIESQTPNLASPVAAQNVTPNLVASGPPPPVPTQAQTGQITAGAT